MFKNKSFGLYNSRKEDNKRAEREYNNQDKNKN